MVRVVLAGLQELLVRVTWRQDCLQPLLLLVCQCTRDDTRDLLHQGQRQWLLLLLLAAV